MTRAIKLNDQEFNLERRLCNSRCCSMDFWVRPESKQTFCSVECYEVTGGKAFLGFGRTPKPGAGGNLWRKGQVADSPGGQKRKRLEEKLMRAELPKPIPIQLGNSRRRS